MIHNVSARVVCTAALLAMAACNTAGEAAPTPGDAPQATVTAEADAPQGATRMVVYKSPTCGCCANWVEHMRDAGFAVEVHDTADVAPVKHDHGVPGHLGSCHTAVVDGYVIEGHVPVEDIQRLLAERPEVAGIAVPGMPVGSPGMEMGSRKDPYDVVAFTKGGGVSVFASH